MHFLALSIFTTTALAAPSFRPRDTSTTLLFAGICGNPQLQLFDSTADGAEPTAPPDEVWYMIQHVNNPLSGDAERVAATLGAVSKFSNNITNLFTNLVPGDNCLESFTVKFSDYAYEGKVFHRGSSMAFTSADFATLKPVNYPAPESEAQISGNAIWSLPVYLALKKGYPGTDIPTMLSVITGLGSGSPSLRYIYPYLRGCDSYPVIIQVPPGKFLFQDDTSVYYSCQSYNNGIDPDDPKYSDWKPDDTTLVTLRNPSTQSVLQSIRASDISYFPDYVTIYKTNDDNL